MTVKIGNQSEESVGPPESAERVSLAFLQSVIDAFPDSLTVIDRDHSVVLANRTAREVFGLKDLGGDCCKCYQIHHRETPCSGENEPCPLRQVIATKAPVRVRHTHFDSEGKEISVAVDAAPVFDHQGEVVQIVESCRDVTEWTLSRHILRIGHHHMAMRPLLEEAAEAVTSSTNGIVVGIRTLDEIGGVSVSSRRGQSNSDGRHGGGCGLSSCIEVIKEGTLANLPPITAGESLYADCRTQFLASMPDEERQRLGKTCDACGCESLALVPISVNGDVFGVLHVAYPRRHAVSPSGLESLERLAAELGTAIQCVRAEEAVQAAHDELEARVQRRTAELTEANRSLQNEIAERARLEREIIQVAAKEQQRIGQELHDGIGQELTGLSYLAQSLYQKLQSRDSAETELAGELARSVPRVLGQIREVVKGLLPLEVGASDLNLALEVLTENVTKQTGISCRFEDGGCSEVHDDDVAIQVYRIAQEGIANAVKHAESQNIVVVLKGEGDHLHLEVRDDGNGIRFSSGEFSGRGLRTMKSRARAMGGELEVGPMDDGGTLVDCVFPRATGNCSDTEGSTQ